MISISAIDGLGFAASTMTLVAFAQKTMVPMRLAALTANLFFIGYGALGQFYPVLVLHLILFPLNVRRLAELFPGIRNSRTPARPETAVDMPEVPGAGLLSAFPLAFATVPSDRAWSDAIAGSRCRPAVVSEVGPMPERRAA